MVASAGAVVEADAAAVSATTTNGRTMLDQHPPSTTAAAAATDPNNNTIIDDNDNNDTNTNKEQQAETEEISTTLSWTSSNVSLSPLNPPFFAATTSETVTTTTATASKAEAEAEHTQKEATTDDDNTVDKTSVVNSAAEAYSSTSEKANLGRSEYDGCKNKNKVVVDVREDDAGDPIVDASVLQRLQMMARQPSNGYDDDDDEDAVMLEGNSDEDDDSENGDEVASDRKSKKNAAGEPQRSFFLPQFLSSQPLKKSPEPTASSDDKQQPPRLNNSVTTDSRVRSNSVGSRSSGGGVFDLFSLGEDEESCSGRSNDADDEDFLQNNSLLHQFHHHGRQPSTIAEEFSESTRRDGDEVFLKEQQKTPLSKPGPQPQKQQPQQAPIRSISSLDSLLRPLLQPQPQHTTSEERGSGPSLSNNNGNGSNSNNGSSSPPSTPLRYRHTSSSSSSGKNNPDDPLAFVPHYRATLGLRRLSRRLLPRQHVPHAGAATWIGFWALLTVTCANYVLTPMRDAIALQVGVQHMPRLTLASTVLAVFSSVPIGWLFEAPDPGRRKLWKRMGLTRGETQGTSLALFYRFFALTLLAYAVGFQGMEFVRGRYSSSSAGDDGDASFASSKPEVVQDLQLWWFNLTKIWMSVGQAMYIAFFLVVHLMKLHCLSLVWGVTTEALEYEEVARKQSQQRSQSTIPMESSKMRLQRLSLIGFGGTLGGILGSFLASSMAQVLRLPGLLLLAASLLEISAELSIELGRIMQKHWEGQQQLFQSTSDLASLDPSMKRSASVGSMKRISSGNSLNRVKSTSDLSGGKPLSSHSLSSAGSSSHGAATASSCDSAAPVVDEDSFSQRLFRGLSTILKSRLLMAIFTYNALYASTTVLLSFQRAALVANRSSTTSVQADTAFLANINMVSSAAIFALQSSGAGAYVAHRCGFRGTLALMPLIRLLGVVALAWWHRFSGGRPPNLLVFLVVDECCKIMNLAVAKPVRESLWRGLSNEARYEAKPIVDTLANRWGGGSAAFLVSFVDKTLDLFGVIGSEHDGVRNIFGFPPVLFLCVIISAWWAAVSADLGKIRKNIDLELKKRQ